jgi:3-phenylpropionate/trans-cinnamate dioxygenase ferredoxin subunit
MPDPINAGKLSDFEDGEPRVILYPGAGAVGVVRIDGEFYAFSNYCTHEGTSLANGYGDLAGTTLICMMHNASFDLRTGQPRGGPAGDPLTMYRVTVEGDDVLVSKS